MDQSTTALSVFGWGDGRRWRRWSRVNERESISTEEGGVRTHKEGAAVSRRRSCVGYTGPPGVAPTTHFIYFR